MIFTVEVDALSFEFRGGGAALRGIRVAIARGECVGLVGPNGAGKSTLLHHLNGLLPDRAVGVSRGEVRILGRRVERATLPFVRRSVGLLFQDPDDQLFGSTVFDDVAYAPLQLGTPEGELALRVRAALASVGLAGFGHRHPDRLSVGEKKRVCLAGLLAYDPEVLVLDEPTAGLDPRGRRQLLDILSRLPCTKIVATHDLALVAELCSRALLLDEGTLLADRPPSQLFADDALMKAHGLECPRLDLAPPLQPTPSAP